MPDTAQPPELIISLWHNKIGVRLAENPGTGTSEWSGKYPVKGTFMADQISQAMDALLNENEALFSPFDNVALLLMDSPNVAIPEYYTDQMVDIAGKYLRKRAGDTYVFDEAPGDLLIAYSVPTSTVHLVREYFSKATCVHMTTILWNAINHHVRELPEGLTRLFSYSTENALIIIGCTGTEMTFSRAFKIQRQDDIAYYTLACQRLLKASENWLITIRDDNEGLSFPDLPHLPIRHRLELPDLKTLIAGSGVCVS